MPTQFTIQPGGPQTHRLNFATPSYTGGARTMTASDMVNSIYTRTAMGGNISDTTPTAVALIGAIEAPVVGSAFDFIVQNSDASADTLTIAAGTGVTLTGTMTIAQNKCKKFIGVVTALGPISTPAVTLFSTEADSTF